MKGTSLILCSIPCSLGVRLDRNLIEVVLSCSTDGHLEQYVIVPRSYVHVGCWKVHHHSEIYKFSGKVSA